MALSEGLFVLLMLWALFMTSQFLVREERWRLVCAGVIAGLAVLTRYVGISLAGALVLVVLPPTRWRSLKSWRNAAALAVPAAVPFAAWLIRNAFHGRSTTDRSLAIHWLTAQQLKDALWTVERWIFLQVCCPMCRSGTSSRSLWLSPCPPSLGSVAP